MMHIKHLYRALLLAVVVSSGLGASVPVPTRSATGTIQVAEADTAALEALSTALSTAAAHYAVIASRSEATLSDLSDLNTLHTTVIGLVDSVITSSSVNPLAKRYVTHVEKSKKQEARTLADQVLLLLMQKVVTLSKSLPTLADAKGFLATHPTAFNVLTSIINEKVLLPLYAYKKGLLGRDGTTQYKNTVTSLDGVTLLEENVPCGFLSSPAESDIADLYASLGSVCLTRMALLVALQEAEYLSGTFTAYTPTTLPLLIDSSHPLIANSTSSALEFETLSLFDVSHYGTSLYTLSSDEHSFLSTLRRLFDSITAKKALGVTGVATTDMALYEFTLEAVNRGKTLLAAPTTSVSEYNAFITNYASDETIATLDTLLIDTAAWDYATRAPEEGADAVLCSTTTQARDRLYNELLSLSLELQACKLHARVRAEQYNATPDYASLLVNALNLGLRIHLTALDELSTGSTVSLLPASEYSTGETSLTGLIADRAGLSYPLALKAGDHLTNSAKDRLITALSRVEAAACHAYAALTINSTDTVADAAAKSDFCKKALKRMKHAIANAGIAKESLEALVSHNLYTVVTNVDESVSPAISPALSAANPDAQFTLAVLSAEVGSLVCKFEADGEVKGNYQTEIATLYNEVKQYLYGASPEFTALSNLVSLPALTDVSSVTSTHELFFRETDALAHHDFSTIPVAIRDTALLETLQGALEQLKAVIMQPEEEVLEGYTAAEELAQTCAYYIQNAETAVLTPVSSARDALLEEIALIGLATELEHLHFRLYQEMYDAAGLYTSSLAAQAHSLARRAYGAALGDMTKVTPLVDGIPDTAAVMNPYTETVQGALITALMKNRALLISLEAEKIAYQAELVAAKEVADSATLTALYIKSDQLARRAYGVTIGDISAVKTALNTSDAMADAQANAASVRNPYDVSEVSSNVDAAQQSVGTNLTQAEQNNAQYLSFEAELLGYQIVQTARAQDVTLATLPGYVKDISATLSYYFKGFAQRAYASLLGNATNIIDGSTDGTGYNYTLSVYTPVDTSQRVYNVTELNKQADIFNRTLLLCAQAEYAHLANSESFYSFLQWLYDLLNTDQLEGYTTEIIPPTMGTSPAITQLASPLSDYVYDNLLGLALRAEERYVTLGKDAMLDVLYQDRAQDLTLRLSALLMEIGGDVPFTTPPFSFSTSLPAGATLIEELQTLAVALPLAKTEDFSADINASLIQVYHSFKTLYNGLQREYSEGNAYERVAQSAYLYASQVATFAASVTTSSPLSDELLVLSLELELIAYKAAQRARLTTLPISNDEEHSLAMPDAVVSLAARCSAIASGTTAGITRDLTNPFTNLEQALLSTTHAVLQDRATRLSLEAEALVAQDFYESQAYDTTYLAALDLARRCYGVVCNDIAKVTPVGDDTAVVNPYTGAVQRTIATSVEREELATLSLEMELLAYKTLIKLKKEGVVYSAVSPTETYPSVAALMAIQAAHDAAPARGYVLSDSELVNRIAGLARRCYGVALGDLSRVKTTISTSDAEADTETNAASIRNPFDMSDTTTDVNAAEQVLETASSGRCEPRLIVLSLEAEQVSYQLTAPTASEKECYRRRAYGVALGDITAVKTTVSTSDEAADTETNAASVRNPFDMSDTMTDVNAAQQALITTSSVLAEKNHAQDRALVAALQSLDDDTTLNTESHVILKNELYDSITAFAEERTTSNPAVVGYLAGASTRVLHTRDQALLTALVTSFMGHEIQVAFANKDSFTALFASLEEKVDSYRETLLLTPREEARLAHYTKALRHRDDALAGVAGDGVWLTSLRSQYEDFVQWYEALKAGTLLPTDETNQGRLAALRLFIDQLLAIVAQYDGHELSISPLFTLSNLAGIDHVVARDAVVMIAAQAEVLLQDITTLLLEDEAYVPSSYDVEVVRGGARVMGMDRAQKVFGALPYALTDIQVKDALNSLLADTTTTLGQAVPQTVSDYTAARFMDADLSAGDITSIAADELRSVLHACFDRTHLPSDMLEEQEKALLTTFLAGASYNVTTFVSSEQVQTALASLSDAFVSQIAKSLIADTTNVLGNTSQTIAAYSDAVLQSEGVTPSIEGEPLAPTDIDTAEITTLRTALSACFESSSYPAGTTLGEEKKLLAHAVNTIGDGSVFITLEDVYNTLTASETALTDTQVVTLMTVLSDSPAPLSNGGTTTGAYVGTILTNLRITPSALIEADPFTLRQAVSTMLNSEQLPQAEEQIILLSQVLRILNYDALAALTATQRSAAVKQAVTATEKKAVKERLESVLKKWDDNSANMPSVLITGYNAEKTELLIESISYPALVNTSLTYNKDALVDLYMRRDLVARTTEPVAEITSHKEKWNTARSLLVSRRGLEKLQEFLSDPSKVELLESFTTNEAEASVMSEKIYLPFAPSLEGGLTVNPAMVAATYRKVVGELYNLDYETRQEDIEKIAGIRHLIEQFVTLRENATTPDARQAVYSFWEDNNVESEIAAILSSTQPTRALTSADILVANDAVRLNALSRYQTLVAQKDSLLYDRDMTFTWNAIATHAQALANDCFASVSDFVNGTTLATYTMTDPGSSVDDGARYEAVATVYVTAAEAQYLAFYAQAIASQYDAPALTAQLIAMKTFGAALREARDNATSTGSFALTATHHAKIMAYEYTAGKTVATRLADDAYLPELVNLILILTHYFTPAVSIESQRDGWMPSASLPGSLAHLSREVDAIIAGTSATTHEYALDDDASAPEFIVNANALIGGTDLAALFDLVHDKALMHEVQCATLTHVKTLYEVDNVTLDASHRAALELIAQEAEYARTPLSFVDVSAGTSTLTLDPSYNNALLLVRAGTTLVPALDSTHLTLLCKQAGNYTLQTGTAVSTSDLALDNTVTVSSGNSSVDPAIPSQIFTANTDMLFEITSLPTHLTIVVEDSARSAAEQCVLYRKVSSPAEAAESVVDARVIAYDGSRASATALHSLLSRASGTGEVALEALNQQYTYFKDTLTPAVGAFFSIVHNSKDISSLDSRIAQMNTSLTTLQDPVLELESEGYSTLLTQLNEIEVGVGTLLATHFPAVEATNVELQSAANTVWSDRVVETEAVPVQPIIDFLVTQESAQEARAVRLKTVIPAIEAILPLGRELGVDPLSGTKALLESHFMRADATSAKVVLDERTSKISGYVTTLTSSRPVIEQYLTTAVSDGVTKGDSLTMQMTHIADYVTAYEPVLSTISTLATVFTEEPLDARQFITAWQVNGGAVTDTSVDPSTLTATEIIGLSTLRQGLENLLMFVSTNVEKDYTFGETTVEDAAYESEATSIIAKLLQTDAGTTGLRDRVYSFSDALHMVECFIENSKSETTETVSDIQAAALIYAKGLIARTFIQTQARDVLTALTVEGTDTDTNTLDDALDTFIANTNSAWNTFKAHTFLADAFAYGELISSDTITALSTAVSEGASFDEQKALIDAVLIAKQTALKEAALIPLRAALDAIHVRLSTALGTSKKNHALGIAPLYTVDDATATNAGVTMIESDTISAEFRYEEDATNGKQKSTSFIQNQVDVDGKNKVILVSGTGHRVGMIRSMDGTNATIVLNQSGIVDVSQGYADPYASASTPLAFGHTRNADSLNGYVFVADGNGTIVLHENVIVSPYVDSTGLNHSRVRPFRPTANFGKTAEHRLTITSPTPCEIRVTAGTELDLTAFSAQTYTEDGEEKPYASYGKQIVFDGKVSLVLEPGAKIRFPQLPAGQEDKGIVLYFNGESQLIFEGTNNRDEYRWRKGYDLNGDYDAETETTYGTADAVRNKIVGVGQLWFNKDAQMQVMDMALVGIEADAESPRTDITLSLQRNGSVFIGKPNIAGGALQIGNPRPGGTLPGVTYTAGDTVYAVNNPKKLYATTEGKAILIHLGEGSLTEGSILVRHTDNVFFRRKLDNSLEEVTYDSSTSEWSAVSGGDTIASGGYYTFILPSNEFESSAQVSTLYLPNSLVDKDGTALTESVAVYYADSRIFHWMYHRHFDLFGHLFERTYQDAYCEVNFDLKINGSGAQFHIDREGFVGFGAGTVNKAGAPNAIDKTNPITAATSILDPRLHNEVPVGGKGAWRLQALHDVGTIALNVHQGSFTHYKVASGSESEASLLAIGPVRKNYSVYLGESSQAVLKGGGNIMYVTKDTGYDGTATDPALWPLAVNIFDVVRPLEGLRSDKGAYTIMGTNSTIRLRGDMGPQATIITEETEYTFTGTQPAFYLALSAPDYATFNEGYVSAGPDRFGIRTGYILTFNGIRRIKRPSISSILLLAGGVADPRRALIGGELLGGSAGEEGDPLHFVLP